MHAVVSTPAEPLGLPFRGGFLPETTLVANVFGLPQASGGSASANSVSRPAQRSLALRPACSPDRLTILYTGGFNHILVVAPIATGWKR